MGCSSQAYSYRPSNNLPSIRGFLPQSTPKQVLYTAIKARYTETYYGLNMIKSAQGEGLAQLVADQVDRMTDEIVALAQSLIRFDSVNEPPWGREGPVQAFVAEQLRGLGCAVDQFRPDEVPGIDDDPAYLRGRDYTDRPNVVGVLPGLGGGPSLHLAAHADVVPIGDRAQWTVE